MKKLLTLENPKKVSSQIQQYLQAAYYSGERILVEGADGELSALVPVEDLEVLEQLDNSSTLP